MQTFNVFFLISKLSIPLLVIKIEQYFVNKLDDCILIISNATKTIFVSK